MKGRENEESLIWNVIWRISQMPRAEQPYFWPREAWSCTTGNLPLVTLGARGHEKDQHCLILNVSPYSYWKRQSWTRSPLLIGNRRIGSCLDKINDEIKNGKWRLWVAKPRKRVRVAEGSVRSRTNTVTGILPRLCPTPKIWFSSYSKWRSLPDKWSGKKTETFWLSLLFIPSSFWLYYRRAHTTPSLVKN